MLVNDFIVHSKKLGHGFLDSASELRQESVKEAIKNSLAGKKPTMESEVEVLARQEEKEAAEVQKKQEQELAETKLHVVEDAKTVFGPMRSKTQLKDPSVPSAAAFDAKQANKSKTRAPKTKRASVILEQGHVPRTKDEMPHKPIDSAAERQKLVLPAQEEAPYLLLEFAEESQLSLPPAKEEAPHRLLGGAERSKQCSGPTPVIVSL